MHRLFLRFLVIPPTRIGIGCERGQVTASAGKEEVKSCIFHPPRKQKVCRQFERFCKDVLECESIDYIRHITARAEHVITFSDLPEPVLEQLHTTDTYPSDMYLFDVCGFHLPIHDDRLGQALFGDRGGRLQHPAALLPAGSERPTDRPAPQQFQIFDSAPQNSIFETLKSKMKE